jgi:hypothetical protein
MVVGAAVAAVAHPRATDTHTVEAVARGAVDIALLTVSLFRTRVKMGLWAGLRLLADTSMDARA